MLIQRCERGSYAFSGTELRGQHLHYVQHLQGVLAEQCLEGRISLSEAQHMHSRTSPSSESSQPKQREQETKAQGKHVPHSSPLARCRTEIL